MNWPPPDETRIEGDWPVDEHPQGSPHWEPEPQKPAPPKQPSFTASGTWSAQGRKGISLQLPSVKRSRPVKPPRPVGASAPAKPSRSSLKLPSFKRSRPAEGAPPVDASGPAKPSSRSSLLSNKAAIAIALVVVLLAAAALYHFTRSGGSSTPTGPSSSPPAAALALSLNKGQSTQYRMDMSLDGTGSVGRISVHTTEHLTQNLSWRIVSVDKNGVAAVQLQTSHGRETTDGKTATVSPLTMHIRVARDGRVLTGASLGTTSGRNGGPGWPGMDQFAPLLPDHPVRPGASWTKSFDQGFPFGSGHLHFTATNHFLRYETVGGTRAAVINSTMTIPVNLSFNLRELGRAIGAKEGSLEPGRNPTMSFTGTMDMNQTAWLDMEQHSLLKSQNTGKFHLAIRVIGFPRSDAPPGGRLGFEGTVTLNLTNVRLVSS